MRLRRKRNTGHQLELQQALTRQVEVCICDLNNHCQCIATSSEEASKLIAKAIIDGKNVTVTAIDDILH